MNITGEVVTDKKRVELMLYQLQRKKASNEHSKRYHEEQIKAIQAQIDEIKASGKYVEIKTYNKKFK